jgi:hypothetical protein
MVPERLASRVPMPALQKCSASDHALQVLLAMQLAANHHRFLDSVPQPCRFVSKFNSTLLAA